VFTGDKKKKAGGRGGEKTVSKIGSQKKGRAWGKKEKALKEVRRDRSDQVQWG